MANFNPHPEMTLEQATKVFDEVPVRVQQTLQQKGFAFVNSPPMIHDGGNVVPYHGQIPPDLTTLDDTGLGWYLGHLSGWLDYVQPQLAESSGQMAAAEGKLKFIEAKLLMVHKMDGEKKRPEPERKAMVLADPRYVEAQANLMYHETYYRHVKAIADAAEQNYAAVSRRISQRQQDIERQKRSNSVGNVHGGPLFRQT